MQTAELQTSRSEVALSVSSRIEVRSPLVVEAGLRSREFSEEDGM